MRAPQDFLAPLRGEIALDIGNEENQKAEQHRDLHYVVQEELDTPAYAGCGVQADKGKSVADQSIQPFHPQYLILYD